MDELRHLMYFGSFWSLWFWIAQVITWSLTSHFTMGVPFDMILQANRENDETGAHARHCEALILAQVFRIVTIFRSFGAAIVGVWSFLIACLATLGIAFDSEFSLALLTILGPLTAVYALSARRAFALDAAGVRGPQLRLAIKRQRFVNQLIGLLAIASAAALAVRAVALTITPMWM